MLISLLRKDSNLWTSLKDVEFGFNTFKRSKELKISGKIAPQVSKKSEKKKKKLQKMLERLWTNQFQSQLNPKRKSLRIKRWMYKSLLSKQILIHQEMERKHKKWKLNDQALIDRVNLFIYLSHYSLIIWTNIVT